MRALSTIAVVVAGTLGAPLPPRPPERTAAPGPPRVPVEGTQLRPALSRMAEGEPHRPEVFQDFATCARCHAPIVAEWRESMHSLASLSNPIYLASFADFSAARGERNTRFCAGCHDPALLFDPQARLTTDPRQPAAHAGVTCGSCHGAVGARGAGNGSYVLTTTPVPLPRPGDPASLAAHRARVAGAALRTDELCASCHRGVLNPEMGHEVVLPGLDEWGAWRRSAYAGNQTARLDEEGVAPRSCRGCHMPADEGHASHRFAGGHTTFAAMIGSPAQAAATRRMVEGAASLDVFPLGPADARQPLPGGGAGPAESGGAVAFDVVIFNEHAGHNFPGGAKDLRDTWLEVAVTDRRGATLAVSGRDHADGSGEDLVYVLQTRVASKEGVIQREHQVAQFRTAVYDHTIPPRDAAVVRYALRLPRSVRPDQLPLTVRASLRHRRLTREMARAACRQARSPLGRAFDAALRARKGLTVDGCVAQPTIEVARAAVTLPGVAPGGEAGWRREYRYGLGLLHQRQEDADDAGRAFERSLAALGPGGGRQRAMSLQGLALVASRQGRAADAARWLAAVDTLVPRQPSTFFALGEANLAVWRFGEAADAFARAATLQKDDRILRGWAIALGSVGQASQALTVAQDGLAIEGRDPLLLRAQLFAYRALGAAPAWQRQAATAVQIYDRDVEAPHLRDQCSRTDAACRADRTPLAVRWLAPLGTMPVRTARLAGRPRAR
jgi:hypothetical protein